MRELGGFVTQDPPAVQRHNHPETFAPNSGFFSSTLTSTTASHDQQQQQEPQQVTESTPFLSAGRNSNPDHSFSSGAGAAGGSQQVRLVKSALYGLQNFYAFMIMLLFMTYNGWVMISVAVGAGVGYWFFGSSGQDGVKGYKETACH